MVSLIVGKIPLTPPFAKGEVQGLPFPAGCISTAPGKVKYDFVKQKIVQRDTKKV
jgi:hypothetical protein